ncbi:hypothetical protein OU995_14670 [Roseateles sp. SL47]|uniref:hypothetical protein n=1 Tax=Roseateles sp. SL47 TaxID=2995138 RepID=UPI00226DB8E5|nr:hypothetical protein [Roseateles sp. SL47]WAC70860.1 hypothetical protein OU995_14670 [Roseateles sp. SL47]
MTLTLCACALIPAGDHSEEPPAIFHEHAPIKNVCIVNNPEQQSGAVLVAIQSELKESNIESRVYEIFTNNPECEAWLFYMVNTQWADFADQGFHPYVSFVSLTLREPSGRIISTAFYWPGKDDEKERWRPTRTKLKPVVKMLLTGNK